MDDITSLEDKGYGGQFSAADGDRIRCLSCSSVLAAELVTIDHWQRLEGESDPADMLAVLGIRCPVCGQRGTLILNYGPEATGSESAILKALTMGPEGAQP